jgi:hypothetical protein
MVVRLLFLVRVGDRCDEWTLVVLLGWVDDVVEATTATVVLLFLRVDFVVAGKLSSGRDISIFVYSDDDDDDNGVSPPLHNKITASS